MDPENQSSSAHKTDNHPTKSGNPSNKDHKVLNILDVAAKLIAACAVVAAAYIANNFQSSMTSTNLLNQREQADSALRASMFHDLIGPIVGSEKSGGDIPADRERLLVELLALNFHEHFELKPLMLHVDDRLAHEEIKKIDQTQIENRRDALRSIARRVLEQQLALLIKAVPDSLSEQQTCIYQLNIEERPQQNIMEEMPSPQPCSTFTRYFDDLISIRSPNGIYTLDFTIQSPDRWEDQNFLISMQITTEVADNKPSEVADNKPSEVADNKPKVVTANRNPFLLTWFDFPLTDNTLLADGTRFSIVIDQVEPRKKKATLKLVWFPQDYFSERERPTNHRQLREKLGLTLK